MRRRLLTLGLGLVLGCSDATDDDGAATAGGKGGSTSPGSGGKGGSTSSGGKGGSTSSSGGKGGSTSSSGGKGGSTSSSGGKGGSTSSENDAYGDARERCVDRTNELRASLGLAPIPRLASAEPCVDGQAKSDSETGKAHGAFDACKDEVKGWRGIAQNECPGYSSVESALGGCLDMMWAEGPGGGHYDNMVGDSTQTACGFYTTPQGKVWMIQDFWTK
jgi:hypothetical protein